MAYQPSIKSPTALEPLEETSWASSRASDSTTASTTSTSTGNTLRRKEPSALLTANRPGRVIDQGHSWIPQGTHPELRSINGAYGPTDDVSRAGFEADLDFQVAIPLVWPQRTVLFQTDDEWYQQDQQRPDTRYPGFFNSKFSLPPFPPLFIPPT